MVRVNLAGFCSRVAAVDHLNNMFAFLGLANRFFLVCSLPSQLVRGERRGFLHGVPRRSTGAGGLDEHFRLLQLRARMRLVSFHTCQSC